jgi:Tfp pilus assembly protein PilV
VNLREREGMNAVRSQVGISLIEVMSAITLFSVIAVGLTRFVISNITINNSSRTVAAATALVQDKLEQIRMTVPVVNTVPADLTAGTHTDPNNPLTPLGASGGTFTRTWSVTSVSQYVGGTVVGARPGMAQVAVTVSWSAPLSGSLTAVTYACTTPKCNRN